MEYKYIYMFMLIFSSVLMYINVITLTRHIYHRTHVNQDICTTNPVEVSQPNLYTYSSASTYTCLPHNYYILTSGCTLSFACDVIHNIFVNMPV